MINNNQDNIQFNTILGYNPFISNKKGNARLSKKLINSYRFYFDMLSLIAQASYEWQNIPLEIPEYQIEKCLFYTGMAGITRDKIAEEYVILPVVYDGGLLNKYGEPERFKMFSYTNTITYDNLLLNKDGLICYNNANKVGNMYLCYRYARRLEMIDTIIDMNLDKQKSPWIVVAPNEDTRNSLKQLFTKIDAGEEAIFATKDITSDEITTLDLKVELKAEELIEAKREIYNEACLYLGITSSLSNKKERLISSEVESESRRYEIYRQIGLKQRQYFCKKVKKLYGLDLQVDFILSDNLLSEDDIEETIIDTDKTKREDKMNKVKKKIEVK